MQESPYISSTEQYRDYHSSMDFVGSRYYRISQILLTWLGLWPYYKQRTKYAICISLSPVLVSVIIFQLSSFLTEEYNVDRLLNVIMLSSPTLYCILKYFITFTKSNEIKELMERVRYDWNSLKTREELKIMHKQANVAKYLTIMWIVTMYTAFCSVILTFFSSQILDIIMPLNESRQPMHFPSGMEYFIDQEKYMVLLTLYFCLIGFIYVTVALAIESISVMYVQHACAMFQITSYRVECTVNNSQMESLVVSKRLNNHKSLVEAIDCHRRAITFTDSFKSVFAFVHLLIIPIGIASLSTSLYRLYEYIMEENIRATSISFIYVLCHFGHIFFANFIGQEIINHSTDVFKKICNTRWYASPLNTQRCLLMMMHRSMKATTLVVSLGLFLPSLEGFTKLISMSLSYFTVIYSRHQT